MMPRLSHATSPMEPTCVTRGVLEPPHCTSRQRDHADVVAALIEGEAEVDARDNDASTPLLDAAKHSARETNFPGRPSTRHPAESIRILLRAGADANARDNWGNTTLLGSGATARC